MAWITVDQAQAGMALASPVTDRMGRLLIPAGAELSVRHVTALATWGVESIEIESDDAVPEPVIEISPELEAQARAEVADVFKHAASDHVFLTALRDLAVARRAHALALSAREAE